MPHGVRLDGGCCLPGAGGNNPRGIMRCNQRPESRSQPRGTLPVFLERVRGATNMLFGGTGFFIDKFHSHAGDGILWLHGYGNVFEKELAPGEIMDIEPGGWLYKDPSVGMDTVIDKLTSGLFGRFN